MAQACSNRQEQATRPDELADQMQRLIQQKGVAQPGFAVVDQQMGPHLRKAQQGNTREQGDHEAVGGGMGCDPPAPVQGDVFAWAFLNGHAIPLQGEISHEMTQGENDQQIDRVLDRKEGLTHHNRLVIYPSCP